MGVCVDGLSCGARVITRVTFSLTFCLARNRLELCHEIRSEFGKQAQREHCSEAAVLLPVTVVKVCIQIVNSEVVVHTSFGLDTHGVIT